MPLIIGIVVLLLALSWLIGIYTDALWFSAAGFGSVFRKTLTTKVLLFVVFGLLMALIVGANLVIAYLLRPPFRPMSPEQQNLERYRVALAPRLTWLLLAVSALVGIIAGLSAKGQWRTYLLWRNGVPFGETDAQFHRDISYYAFTYPMQRYALGFLFVAVVLAAVGALVVHYIYGGIRLQAGPGGDRITTAARAHLSVLVGLFVLLKAAAYWLDRYGLLFSQRSTAKVGSDSITGASYTDVHAVLPAKMILLVIALICAVVFIANVKIRNFIVPGIAFGLLVVSAILIGGAYPAIVQQFTVKPNANSKEAPYISRNIAATKKAYGITTVDQMNYPARTEATPEQLRADTGTVPNVRLLDPTVLSAAFTQLQQVRPVYGFSDKLDVDRYTIDGKKQDYIVGVRELDSANLSGSQDNWINRHLVYTHGNGFVAAPANQTDNGKPIFVSGALTEADKQQTGEKIPVQQPRIYFGELINDYSIVGKEGSDAKDREFDRPTGSASEGEGQQLTNTYAGDGGVKIGSAIRRLAYALYFREPNILLNGAINDNSKILYVRDPRERVEKVAPFLQADGDPYPAVVDGRVVWIVDAYTTSDGYPYAQRETLGDVTADTQTTNTSSVSAQPEKEVNYIRNSVKATVDAYNGTVTLYQWGPKDPVLETWEKAFPGLIEPSSKISDDLRQHFRYPQDLFKVQRELLSYYHVTNPQEFYNGQSFWSVPQDPTTQKGETKAAQPAYYVLAQFPDQNSPQFQLTTVLNPINKENLAAVVSVSSDPQDYGTMSVLELPGDKVILGPNQVQRNFTSQSEIAQDITLLNQNNSKVIFGNLLTLPVSGGLLYVEPLYVEGQGSGSFPQLRKVLLAFGDKIAYENTLGEALDSLFGSGAGSAASPATTAPGTTPSESGNEPSPSPSGSASPSPSASPPSTGAQASPQVTQAVQDINSALQALAEAQKKGDFAGIGQAQSDLAAAIKEYEAAQKAAAAK